jgi:hypothetical protein
MTISTCTNCNCSLRDGAVAWFFPGDVEEIETNGSVVTKKAADRLLCAECNSKESWAASPFGGVELDYDKP